MPASDELAITEISVEAQPQGPGSTIDLLSRRTDDFHYAFRASGTDSLSSALIRFHGGEAVDVRCTSWRLQEGQWVRLALRNDGGRLTGLVNGAPIISQSVPSLGTGQVGIRGGFEPGIRIRRVRIVAERLDDASARPLVFLNLW